MSRSARLALRLKRLRVERPSRVFRPSASTAENLRFFLGGGVAEKLLFRGERRAVCECGYICSSSRPRRPGPWRRHGEKQECDRQGRTRRTRRNPASASVSSLLVFIASFVCTVAAPPKTKDAKGVLRRRGPVEATWEGDGSPLKCTLIAAKQKKIIIKKREKKGGGKQQRPPAVSGSVGEVAEIGIQPSSLIASPYLLLLLLLLSSSVLSRLLL